MEKVGKFIQKFLPELILGFIFLYLLGSFIPAIAFNNGNEQLGRRVNSVYRFFCHQRVERSLFIFAGESEDSFYSANFYSVEYLQEEEVIPYYNPYVPDRFSKTVFGYPYVGNEVVGYKTAICIRDLAIYIALLFTGILYMAYSRKNGGKIYKFSFKFCLMLMLPMAVDVLIQILGQIFDWSFVTDAYINSIIKRIITGALFGIGFSLFIFPNLQDSLDDKKELNDKEI